MLEQVLSMLLTFGFMWHGRDRVWTPTFEGTRAERFVRAIRHYDERMGLTADYTLEVFPERMRLHGGIPQGYCAWVRRPDDWEGDHVGFSTHQSCEDWKPEVLALHEQCHRRMMHLDRDDLTKDEEYREVRECMVAYSAKERR